MAYKKLQVTPVITAGLYHANDALGGLMQFNDVPRRGTVNRVIVSDLGNQKANVQLFLYSSQPSAIADHAAYAPTDPDLLKCLGAIDIPIANYIEGSSNAIAWVADLDFGFVVDDATLFGQLKTIGTPTYTSVSDISVTLIIDKP